MSNTDEEINRPIKTPSTGLLIRVIRALREQCNIGSVYMRLPRAAITEWIFRSLQSCISLCEFVMLGLPILDKDHILALEYQTHRLLWLVNELRERTGQPHVVTPRGEYQMREDGELGEDDELPFQVVIAPPSDYQIGRQSNG